MSSQLPGARHGGLVVDGGPVVRCDPDAIHTEAMRVLNRARVLREAHAASDGLTRAARWESPAGEAFAQALAQVRPMLLEVAGRFESGGAVLREYAHEAGRVQAQLANLSDQVRAVEHELDALAGLDGSRLDEVEQRAVLARYTALSPQVTDLMTARQQVYEEFLAYDRAAATRLDSAGAAHLANPRDYDLAEALQRLESQSGKVLGLAGDYGGPPGEAAVEVAKKPQTVLVAGDVAASLYLRARYTRGSYRDIAATTGFTLTERLLTKRLTRVVQRGVRQAGAVPGRGVAVARPRFPGAALTGSARPGSALTGSARPGSPRPGSPHPASSPLTRRAQAAGRAVRGQVTQTAEAKATTQVGGLVWSIARRGIEPRQRVRVLAAAGAVTAIHAVKATRSVQAHVATTRSRAAHLRHRDREENPPR